MPDDLFPDDFRSDFNFFEKIRSENNPFTKKDYEDQKKDNGFVSKRDIPIVFSLN